MKNHLLFLISICFSPIQLHSVPHTSSFPYIAPDTFRQFCDFILDEDSTFDPLRVKQGDALFVPAHFLDTFFTHYHPCIQYPYILVSHDSDQSAPGAYKEYLNDNKIIAWFVRNIDYSHPKLHPIPIGIANQMYPHGNIAIITECIQKFAHNNNRKLLYLNFGMTHPERREVFNLFRYSRFCTVVNSKSYPYNAGKDTYHHLVDLAEHKFVLSPRGNGLDCHRTWEALLMGCFPIVKTSTLDVLYEDLPVVIINNYTEVTEEFLHKKYDEILQKKYSTEKLYAPYWINIIKKYQEEIRNG